MGTTPASIANQALDAIGWNMVIGDLEEGTREAQICLRSYGQCVRQLLRIANWDFARKIAPLVLLADATGSTPNVGTLVPIPWVYEYAYPIDCIRARFVPRNGLPQPAIPPNNISIPQPYNQVPGQNSSVALYGLRLVPAPFKVQQDFNYPPDPSSSYEEVQGISQAGRTVVVTNVQNAYLVYTSLVMAPTQWDPLFREAVVIYMASKIAMSIWSIKDPKVGFEFKTSLTAEAQKKLNEARIADGNEGTTSISHVPDFMRVRRSGRSMGGGIYNTTGIIYPGGCGDDGGGYGWDWNIDGNNIL